jgi:hypothetical protein
MAMRSGDEVGLHLADAIDERPDDSRVQASEVQIREMHDGAPVITQAVR